MPKNPMNHGHEVGCNCGWCCSFRRGIAKKENKRQKESLREKAERHFFEIVGADLCAVPEAFKNLGK